MTSNDDEKRREFALLLEEEGYTPEEARQIADEGFTHKPEQADEMLKNLRARYPEGPRVRHPGTVDFRDVQRQRAIAELDQEIARDEAAWEALKDRLIEVMATSGQSDISITSATLRALLEVLLQQRGDMSLDEAKKLVANVLAPFQ